MLTPLLTGVGLLAVFYVIAKVCDEYFVKSLDIIAKKLKLSEDVAGATFMAIGTSAPEFATAAIALTKVGSEQVGAGTIVGSAIFNILVIVGASSAVATAYLKWRPVVRDMGFYILSILLLLFTFRDGVITLGEVIVYVAAYAVYIVILAFWSRWFPDYAVQKELGDIEKAMVSREKAVEKSSAFGPVARAVERALAFTFPNLEKRPGLYPLTFAISILYIIVLSWLLVEFGIAFAHSMGIPEVIIALTILAGGTPIPDMPGSLIVARQGRGDMAVSNAVGGNTFDILVCLGLPWLVYILWTGEPMVVSTENLLSSILLLFFTVIAMFFILAVQKFKIGRRAGFVLLGLYALYFCYALYGAYNPDAFPVEMLFR